MGLHDAVFTWPVRDSLMQQMILYWVFPYKAEYSYFRPCKLHDPSAVPSYRLHRYLVRNCARKGE